MLNNGLVFVNQFAQLQSSLLAEQAPSSSSSLNLVDRDLMLRRRLFQCCVALAQSPAAAETLQQSSLLTAALGVFADPERYTGSLVQAAIAASSGTFTSVWDATDGFGYGVTTLIDDTGLDLNRDLVERDLDATLHRPVQRAAEHDPLLSSSPAPPPATGVVDAAIQVFGVFFVSQPLQAQTALMQTLSGFVASNKTEKNPGRRMAILVNATAALSAALEQTMGQGSLASSRSGDNFAVPQLNSLMRDVIKVRSFSGMNLNNGLRRSHSLRCYIKTLDYASSAAALSVDSLTSLALPSWRRKFSSAFLRSSVIPILLVERAASWPLARSTDTSAVWPPARCLRQWSTSSSLSLPILTLLFTSGRSMLSLPSSIAPVSLTLLTSTRR